MDTKTWLYAIERKRAKLWIHLCIPSDCLFLIPILIAALIYFTDRCATAYILLAEEEATTIVEAEKLFKQALKAGEGCYRRSQQLQHHGAQYEAQHSK